MNLPTGFVNGRPDAPPYSGNMSDCYDSKVSISCMKKWDNAMGRCNRGTREFCDNFTVGLDTEPMLPTDPRIDLNSYTDFPSIELNLTEHSARFMSSCAYPNTIDGSKGMVNNLNRTTNVNSYITDPLSFQNCTRFVDPLNSCSNNGSLMNDCTTKTISDIGINGNCAQYTDKSMIPMHVPHVNNFADDSFMNLNSQNSLVPHDTPQNYNTYTNVQRGIRNENSQEDVLSKKIMPNPAGRLTSNLDNLPCQRYRPWSYNNCFGFYDGETHTSCQFVNVVDVEDFMNNEKRKEKSRDAARCRRSRESEIFADLGGALPLSKETVSQLDKASIMRLAISFLKVRNMIQLLPKITKSEVKSEADQESVFLKAVEGFLLVLSPEGDLVYISENVSDYLGINQVDIMGQNIYEYSHPCDHEEMKDILSCKTFNDEENITQSFFIRLKCTLTSKGRNVNLKSASYKVINFTGHMLIPDEKNKKEGEMIPQRCLIAIGQPIPHPSNIEIPLDKKTFLSKHSLDMKFTYADEKMSEVLGYEPSVLIGKSVYDYYHAMDSDAICAGFKSLFSKGQCETRRYRFLAARGGFAWLVTQATLLRDKLQRPQSVVCVHYVVSGIESQDEVYSLAQLSSVKANAPIIVSPPSIDISDNCTEDEIVYDTKPTTIADFEDKNATVSGDGDSDCTGDIIDCEDKNIGRIKNNLNKHKHNNANSSSDIVASNSDVVAPKSTTKTVVNSGVESEGGPQTATSKIFAPRTEEMNKGFLMFSDEEPGFTILKDEPDDLTHLAPTAGDVCVPLAENFLTDDMFDELIMASGDVEAGGYCSLLLTDDLRCALGSDGAESPCSASDSVTGGGDPFMAYRDEYDLSSPDFTGSNSNTASPSSGLLLSPGVTKSPGGCSMPSLCSPGDSLGDDDHISTFMSLQMESEEENDLSNKAPYIPMNVGDDLPLLTSEDLMWGALPEDKLSKGGGMMSKSELNSSLAQLLCQSVISNNGRHISKLNDHGGGLVDPNEVLDQIYSNTKATSDQWTTIQTKNRLNNNKSPPQISIPNNIISLNNNNSTTSNNNITATNVKNNSTSPSAKKLQTCGTSQTTTERAPKRVNSGSNSGSNGCSTYDTSSKRSRTSEPKEKLSGELLHQLMSTTTTQKPRSKGRIDWSTNGRHEKRGGAPGNTLPQPSDSVLMNLLGQLSNVPPSSVPPSLSSPIPVAPCTNSGKQQRNLSLDAMLYERMTLFQQQQQQLADVNRTRRRELIRKNSFSLLDPEGATIPSLMDLSEQDYDVNAPINDTPLLQGPDLINALDFSDPMCIG